MPVARSDRSMSSRRRSGPSCSKRAADSQCVWNTPDVDSAGLRLRSSKIRHCGSDWTRRSPRSEGAVRSRLRHRIAVSSELHRAAASCQPGFLRFVNVTAP
jgi:hypothetical protein